MDALRHRASAAHLGFACVVALLGAPRLSAQNAVQEYLIPRANAFPHDPAVSADGIAWYTDQSNSYIGRFDPATAQFTDRATPTPGSGPHGITVASDGYVWYTGQSTGRLGRVDPTTFAIVERVLPANANRPHTPIAHQGAIWFTAQTNDTYGRFDPTTFQAQVWNAPAGSRPYGIAPAPDGSLWIALFGTNRIASVDLAAFELHEHELPWPDARPRRIGVTSDGAVWYVDYARGSVGRLSPSTGEIVEWSAPAGHESRPYAMAIDDRDRIWFVETGPEPNRLVGFDPAAGEFFSSTPIPSGGGTVRHMVYHAPTATLWFGTDANTIGRATIRP